MAIPQPFEKKNIVVTGGAGFIGSHLLERLLREHRVICIDNLLTSNLRNIEHLLKNQDFEFVRADINAPLDLESFAELKRFRIQFQGIQDIYHLAVPTSAKNFDRLKEATLMANSAGMRNVLDLARKYNARFLHASSSVVYGPREPGHEVFAETDLGRVNHLSPRAVYDEGRRFAETMVETYRQIFGLDTRIVRIFRTYGPRLRLYDGEMIMDFITDALDGKDVVIYGDENFTTTLMYVDDAVDGIMRAMRAPTDLDVVNLGGDGDVRLSEVAAQVIALTGSSSKIVYEPPLLFMTPLGIPDIRKAKEELGWLPLVRLEDGLKKSIDYARAHKSLLGL